jgi:hypothetical protein
VKLLPKHENLYLCTTWQKTAKKSVALQNKVCIAITFYPLEMNPCKTFVTGGFFRKLCIKT